MLFQFIVNLGKGKPKGSRVVYWFMQMAELYFSLRSLQFNFNQRTITSPTCRLPNPKPHSSKIKRPPKILRSLSLCCAQNELFNQRPIPIIHILPTGKLTLDLLTQVHHTTQLGVNIRAEDHSTSTHSKVTLNKQLFQGKKRLKKCQHKNVTITLLSYYTSSY